MSKNWRLLYDALPANRREVIEARVAGELARRNKQAYSDNPHDFGDGCNPLWKAWQEGYYDADEAVLVEWLRERRASR